jgi:hypothetical protein
VGGELVTLLADQLKSCPHYERLPEGCDALKMGYDPETCGGCGGDPQAGPSCICPVFGESEDA